MKNMFFKPEEDFKKIIETIINPQDITLIKPIITGWTNIVIEVSSNDGVYYFRFPRDNFWSKMIIKEYNFCKFIYGKTSFMTPQLNLYYDNNRPFSVHKKIEGTCLTERIKDLSDSEKELLVADICKFINELANIDINLVPNECNMKLFDFLDELCKGHFSDITLWHDEFFKTNDEAYLVHGDLNPGNILVDDNNRVVAILDFCFAGIGNPYSDIGWFISRSSEDFKRLLIDAYEKETNQKMDLEKLDGFIKVWIGIGKGYVDYIKKNNPDIKLPDAI